MTSSDLKELQERWRNIGGLMLGVAGLALLGMWNLIDDMPAADRRGHWYGGGALFVVGALVAGLRHLAVKMSELRRTHKELADSAANSAVQAVAIPLALFVVVLARTTPDNIRILIHGLAAGFLAVTGTFLVLQLRTRI